MYYINKDKDIQRMIPTYSDGCMEIQEFAIPILKLLDEKGYKTGPIFIGSIFDDKMRDDNITLRVYDEFLIYFIDPWEKLVELGFSMPEGFELAYYIEDDRFETLIRKKYKNTKSRYVQMLETCLYLHEFILKLPKAGSSSRPSKVSITDIVEFLEQHPYAFEITMQTCPTCGRYMYINKGIKYFPEHVSNNFLICKSCGTIVFT